MIELVLALALEIQRPVPRAVSDCRPRQHLMRGAPPPPVFSIGRYEGAIRMSLAAYRCPDGAAWRVNRYDETGGGVAWVLGSACPAMVAWIEGAARLPIPPAVLAPFPETPRNAAWFTLSSRFLDGGDHMEITFVERPGGPRNAIAAWAREGEAVFARCGPAQGWVGR